MAQQLKVRGQRLEALQIAHSHEHQKPNHVAEGDLESPFKSQRTMQEVYETEAA